MIFPFFSYFRAILFLLIFINDNTSCLKAAHLMIQDLSSTEQDPVFFKGKSIQEWHQGLILEEQKLKDLLPVGDQTNLIVGKFVIFPRDAEREVVEIPLHTLISLTQSIVFDSAAKRDGIRQYNFCWFKY